MLSWRQALHKQVHFSKTKQGNKAILLIYMLRNNAFYLSLSEALFPLMLAICLSIALFSLVLNL